jgi:proline iminopeptidase
MVVISGLLLSVVCVAQAIEADSEIPGKTKNTVEGKFTRDGVDLYYRVVGDSGPYVVILSGGPGGDVRSMQSVADELSKDFRCVMLEQRGTGRSKLQAYNARTVAWSAYEDDIEALRVHLSADQLILVGNSWGMMLALSYGAAYPTHTRAIVTLGSGPLTDGYARLFSDNEESRLSPMDLQVSAYWANPDRIKKDPERAAAEKFRAHLPAYCFSRKVALETAKSVRAGDINPDVETAWLAANTSFDLRTKLPNITAPVLLIQGRQDIAGEANILEAHHLLKTSTLCFISQCGHMPWLEKPAETWKLMQQFFDQAGPN